MTKNLLVTIGLASLLFASGCKSSSVYASIITLTQVRDSIMTEFGSMYRQGLIDKQTEAKIMAADSKYLSAARLAELALVAYKNGGTQGDYLNSLIAVRASIAELINLLRPLASPSKVSTFESNLSKANEL